MANINGIRVFVKDEQFSHSAEVTKHKVEKGLPLTDNVQRNASTITIKGEIVGSNASNDINTFRGYMEDAVLIYYVGRNYTLGNYVITNFETSHPNTIWGGCSFSLTMQEVRFAKSSYLRKETASTAKVTNASKAQLADVTTTATTNQSVKSTSDTGTKAVTKTSGNSNTARSTVVAPYIKKGYKCVYYTAKKGDTIYSLFGKSNAPFKKYKTVGMYGAGNDFTNDKIRAINKSYMSDSKTFIAGKRIVVGFEKF